MEIFSVELAGVPVGTWVAGVFGWRWAFLLVCAITIVLMVLMVTVLPRNSHIVRIGFLPQFRLFLDRRIQLGVADVMFGAAASYVFYTYLTPIMRDEMHVPERFLSIGLVVFGAACLWSNLYGGKLADRGRGVEPLTHIRPIYCVHTLLLASLILVHWVPAYGVPLLVVLGMFMYLQNSASQVLYMDVAAQSHPGSLNLAASLNSMSFNIGIALGSAVGGRRSGQRSSRTDVAWPGRRGVHIARRRHDHAAASVRGEGPRILRKIGEVTSSARRAAHWNGCHGVSSAGVTFTPEVTRQSNALALFVRPL